MNLTLTRRPEHAATRRSSRRAVALALLIAAGTGCKEVEVFPQRVQVAVTAAAPTTAVDVWARYRKKKGGEILNDRITWHTSTPGVMIYPTPSGRDARVTVPTNAPGQIRIRVHAGSKSDELVIDVVQPVGDQAQALTHGTPSVVMFADQAASGCPLETTMAFVGGGALEPRDAGCVTPDVVQFTAYYPPKRGPIAWTPGSETVSFPVLAQATAQPVRVWLIQNADYFAINNMSAAQVTALNDERRLEVDNAIHNANGVFYSSRVGVRVDRLGPVGLINSSATNCRELLDEIKFDDELSGDASAPDIWSGDIINVYVMEAFSGARGEYCLPTQVGDQANVLRLQSNAIRSTLVHEIGHLWGLYVPWGLNGRHTGHVDRIGGFAQDNVMWGRLNLETSAARTRFSLGQVYRMHFDKRSFLATGATTDCGCDPFAVTCGRLSKDVRPLAKANGALGASAAYCEAPYP